jgi:hypothetical protein
VKGQTIVNDCCGGGGDGDGEGVGWLGCTEYDAVIKVGGDEIDGKFSSSISSIWRSAAGM